MRKFIHIKFFSWVFLVVILTVTLNGVHESAHAMQSQVSAASDQLSHSEISTPHQCPCTPLEQHKDYDGCDTCINCACHAPLVVQPFQIGYNPIILESSASNPLKHLPEVFLSLFVPPDSASI